MLLFMQYYYVYKQYKYIEIIKYSFNVMHFAILFEAMYCIVSFHDGGGSILRILINKKCCFKIYRDQRFL